MIRIILIILVTFAAVAPAQERWSRRSRESSDSSLPAEYQTVVDNNIFVRQRGRRAVEPTTRPTVTPPPPPVERSMILTGIVLEEGVFRAYIEDTRSNTILRVSAGDPIASGAVGQITLDSIAYESADGLRWIEIGQDLTGGVAMFGTRPTATTSLGGSTPAAGSTGGAVSPSTGGAGGDVAPAQGQPADPSQMSIEERLRMRARQQRQR